MVGFSPGLSQLDWLYSPGMDVLGTPGMLQFTDPLLMGSSLLLGQGLPTVDMFSPSLWQGNPWLTGSSNMTQGSGQDAAMLQAFVTALILASISGNFSFQGPGSTQPPGSRDRIPGPPPPPPPQVIDGPAKSEFKDGQLTLSGEALTKIWNDPTSAKEVVRAELTSIFGTDNISGQLEKLIGVKIETGQNHIIKQLNSFRLYDDIVNNITRDILESMNLPTELGGPAKTTFLRGGVLLGQDVLNRIRQNPGDIENIIIKAVQDAAGSTDNKVIMHKVFDDNRDFGADGYNRYFKGGTGEVTGLIDDLVKRVKFMLNLPE